MTMREIHSEAIDSIIVIYHEFILSYAENEKIVYGVVEGKDDPNFYRSCIDDILPDNWSIKLFKTNGKKQLLETYDKFDWNRFSKKRIVLFIDRDLSNFLGEASRDEENIYTTDGYSIENSIVTRSVCERILSEAYNLCSLRTEEMQSILSIFDRSLNEFTEYLIPVMAMIIQWRRSGKNPQLNNIEMKDIFYIRNGCVSVRDQFKQETNILKYIHEKCMIRYSTPKISKIKTMLKGTTDYRTFIRGKFLFWFFAEFCASIHNSCLSLCPSLRIKPRARLPFSVSNCIIMAGPRAKTPYSLKKFLENTICSYINLNSGDRIVI